MFLAEEDSYRPDSVFEVESKKYDKNKLSETRLFLEFNNDQPDDVILGYEGETEKVYYLLNKIKLDAITNRIIDVCTK